MKQKLKDLILEAAQTAHKNGKLKSDQIPEIEVDEPKFKEHGDFSANIAMISASIQKMAPRKIAQAIIDSINDPDQIISKTEIAGPGFINFFIKPVAWYPVLKDIHKADTKYGASDIGKGRKVQIEFVSSNPTGPLHVGHGRGAAIGDATANILSFCGYDVQREYYINDSGRQINTLGRSVFLRYKQLFGENADFPDDCYQGDYIKNYAQEIKEDQKDALLKQSEENAVPFCAQTASNSITSEIKQDLIDFGVEFENWFSEQSLYDSGKVQAVLDDFSKQNLVYENQGAKWFKTTDFGDEKDRVVIRQNGQTTYFASDIAYHKDKFDRGFEKVIDVWGADHHGYIDRVTAAVQASGYKRDQFKVILVQLVNLLRKGQPIAMSTRAGEFVTLKDVVSEVGKDAARFIFLTRHYESPLDFDLELAKKKTNDNPVFYVQYVHARISSIARKAKENELTDMSWDNVCVSKLKEPEEIDLIKNMARYPDVVYSSAILMEPHRITFYLINLAAAFHAYYNKHRILTDDSELTLARLYLVIGVQNVIRNGLLLLGVSAPEKM